MTARGGAGDGGTAAQGRRADLDWMRLALVSAAFPLSVARALSVGEWQVSWTAAVTLAAREAIPWLVPLFLAVSGASAWHALQGHGAEGYLVARVLRLFVPLAAAALVLAGLSAAGLAGLEMLEGPRGWFPWYLAAVFVLSFLLPPLRLALGTRAGKRLLAGLSSGARFAGVLQVMGVLAAAAAILPVLPGAPAALAAGRWGACFPAAVFLLGSLLHAEPRLLACAARQRWVSAACAVIALAAAAACSRFLPALAAAGVAARGLASWCLCLALLGFGSARLSAARPVPPLLREASLPFSVLAQPCAGLLAAAASGWKVPAGATLAVLAPAAFITVSVLYAAVRRVPVFRFCFGLAPLGTQGGSS
jgi:hypothetical protein